MNVGCRLFCWLLVSVSLTQCGYTLQHRLKDTFTSEEGIFVPVFENITDETGIERIFTNALIRELLSRREIVLTKSRTNALELRGKIIGVRRGASVHTSPGFQGLRPYQVIPSEIGVEVTVILELWNVERTGVLWSGRFSGFRRVDAPVNRTFDFQAPSSVGNITDSVVESTYATIARDIMRDVYDDMLILF